MALSTLVAADVTLVTSFPFGGTHGKKRKMATFTLNDPAATSGGMVIGGAAGDIPVSVFGFTKVESCSAVQVYTTSSGAAVRIYPAAPNLAGTSIMTGMAATATDTEAARQAVTDITIATTESAQITLIGY